MRITLPDKPWTIPLWTQRDRSSAVLACVTTARLVDYITKPDGRSLMDCGTVSEKKMARLAGEIPAYRWGRGRALGSREAIH